jgi:hypothetical protein
MYMPCTCMCEQMGVTLLSHYVIKRFMHFENKKLLCLMCVHLLLGLSELIYIRIIHFEECVFLQKSLGI